MHLSEAIAADAAEVLTRSIEPCTGCRVAPRVNPGLFTALLSGTRRILSTP